MPNNVDKKRKRPEDYGTIQSAPAWYSEARFKNIRKARDLRKVPYKPYTNKKGRLAERTDLQRQAAQHVRDLINRQNREGIGQQANTQLRNANQQNIMNQIQPYLAERADTNPLNNYQQYMNPYQQDVARGLRQESTEHLLEDILPRINASFIGQGAFHGGSRSRFIGKAVQKSQQSLQRALSDLLARGHEKAMESGHEHARLKANEQLQKGQLASSAAGIQKEADLIGAREMQNLSQLQQQQGLQGAQALNQFGTEEQKHEQARLNIPYQEHLEQMEYPWKQLQREANIHGATPPPGFQTMNAYIPTVDIPMNPYTAAAGGLGVGSELMNPLRRASGGRVTEQYEQPDTTQMQALANQFQTPGRDPRWGYLGAMGATMLANPGMNPLEAFGHGALAGRDAMNSEIAHEDERMTHAANLMDKINHTRQIQQQMLQDYDLRKEQNLLTRRGQNLEQEYRNSKLSLLKDKARQAPVKIDKDEKKILETLRNQISNASKVKRYAKQISELNNKLDTGPLAGSLAASETPIISGVGKYLGQIGGIGSVEDQQKFQKIATTLALHKDELSKGRSSLGRVRLVQTTKPGLDIKKGANKFIDQDLVAEADYDKAEARFVTNFVNSGKGSTSEGFAIFDKLMEENPEALKTYYDKDYIAPQKSSLSNPQEPQQQASVNPFKADDPEFNKARIAQLEAQIGAH
jgi:hypothetical protein